MRFPVYSDQVGSIVRMTLSHLLFFYYRPSNLPVSFNHGEVDGSTGVGTGILEYLGNGTVKFSPHTRRFSRVHIHLGNELISIPLACQGFAP